jgi:hypothetical protein
MVSAGGSLVGVLWMGSPSEVLLEAPLEGTTVGVHLEVVQLRGFPGSAPWGALWRVFHGGDAFLRTPELGSLEVSHSGVLAVFVPFRGNLEEVHSSVPWRGSPVDCPPERVPWMGFPAVGPLEGVSMRGHL